MKLHVGLFLVSGLLSLYSASSHAIDLIQVLQLASEQDEQLMISRIQLEYARLNLPKAQSAYLPQVFFDANATYQELGNNRHVGVGPLGDIKNDQDNTETTYGYKLKLQQSLYSAETLATVAAVEAGIMKSEAEYNAAAQDLLVRVTEAYLNILSAQDNVEFVQAEKNAIGRQLERAKKRFEVGWIAITDVKEAQASYDLSLAQEIIANNMLDIAKEALRLIIGQPLSDPLQILEDEVPLVIPEPASSSAWVETAQQTNLSLIAAEAALKAANENRRIAKSSRLPTVDLNASYGQNDIDSDTNNSSNIIPDISTKYDTDNLSISVQLTIPLYTGGRTSAKIEQAEAVYSAALHNLRLQKRLVSQQTNNAYLAVVSSIGKVNALKQALISTTAALEATEAGFNVGARTSVDVLNSLRETYRSRRDYASARYDYLVNTLKLKQAAGILNNEDISVVNQWLSR